MNLHEQVRQLLRVGDPAAYQILFDVLEENAWDMILLEYVATEMVKGHPPADFTILVLEKLARVNYPAAVEAHLVLSDEKRTGDPYRSRDSGVQYRVIDAINTAHCRVSKGQTWQQRLDLTQMELVTGEQGGDLGPWEITGYSRGRWQGELADLLVMEPGIRRYTIDFAPEYLERELEREFPDASGFKTVWYSDGGNFGPSFDDMLVDEDGVWRQVRQFAAGREETCPFTFEDDESAEGNDLPIVTLEQTYCGESPGRRCSMCDEPIGEGHGIVYMGELGAAVFMLDPALDDLAGDGD